MLYYSGALEQEGVQNDPFKSLGGFKSSSQIANGEVHNLFPKIDKEEVVKNIKRSRLIVLQNLTNSLMQNIKIWSDQGKFFSIKIGVIEPYYNQECNKYSFEKIAKEELLPYQTQLQEYDENNPLVIDSLEKEKMIGIWIRRELKMSEFAEEEKSEGEDEESCEVIIENLEKQLELNSDKSEDQFNLNILWD